MSPERDTLDRGQRARLAARVRAARTRTATPPTEADPSPPAGAAIPLSAAQRRLLFLDRLRPGSAAYVVNIAVELDGPLDAAALARAAGHVVHRHPTLRGVVDGDGTTVRPWSPTMVTLTEHDLTGHDLTGPEPADPHALVARLGARPFAVGDDLPVRFDLVRHGPDRHLLLVSAHHLVIDAWSMGIVLADLAAAYRSPAAEPPPPRTGYAGYADREARDHDRRRPRVARRAAELAGAGPVGLVARRPRGDSPDAGRVLSFRWDAELTDGLRELATSRGTTVFAVLLAGLALVLHRHTGRRDITVGTAVAGRDRPDLETEVGLFVNTVLLRVPVADDATAGSLVDAAGDAATAALDAADLPFDELIEALSPHRDATELPLLDVMLVLQNAPLPTPRFDGLDAALHSVDNGTAKTDLTWFVVPDGAGVVCHLEYRTTVLDDADAEGMAARLEHVLRAAVAHPDLAVAELDPLPPAEHAALARLGAPATTPEPATVLDLFDARLAARPDATALVCGPDTLTYRELAARAAAAAARLRAGDVRPGDRVATLAGRGTELVITQLAILRLGAAYVPLDPSWPAARIDRLLAATGARVLVTDREHPGRATVPLTELTAPSPVDPSPTVPAPGPDTPAYVMITSGSTGEPKAVVVPHRGIARLADGRGWALLGPEDTVLGLAPVAFDAATFEVWGALLCGATLAIVPDPAPGLADIAAALARHRVTVAWFTAGLFHALVDEDVAALAALRLVLAGGDVLSPRRVRRLLDQAPDLTVINGYGPTETTTFACCHPMRASASVEGPVPIGRPIASTSIRLVDARGGPVPLGAVGEIAIAGDGVALGYLDQPAETERRFVEGPSGREYRTGDLGRWRADGVLEFLGRADRDQVKVRGHRIGLAEVEHALGGRPGIRDAAVVVAGDGDDRALHAFVVTDDGAALPALQRAAAAELPAVMVPVRWTRLDRLPLEDRGKPDRAALSAMAARAPTAGETPDAAAPSELEGRVAALWAQVVGGPDPAPDDDFFVAGGSSLSALRLLERVRREWDVELSLAWLYAAPTVRELAARIEAPHPPAGPGRAAAPAVPHLDPDIRPSVPPRDAGTWSRVLLTGATGFLGTSLLAALLARTDAEVVCLVRGRDAEAATERLDAACAHHGVAPDPARVRVLAADLTEPGLGLSDRTRAHLARGLDAIVHNGARVHLLETYEQLAPANVTATAELLRLATTDAAVPVHHVSTLGVLPAGEVGTPARWPESAPPDDASGLADGYARSKWAAEHLVLQAAHRGLPVSVLRPGRIGGHTRTGIWNHADFLCRLLRCCVRLAAVPTASTLFELTPVDWVADAALTIAGRDLGAPGATDPDGVVHHLAHPAPVDAAELFGLLLEAGYDLRVLPYEAWRRELDGWPPDPGDGPDADLRALAAALPHRIDARAPARFDTARTAALLASRSGPGTPPDVATQVRAGIACLRRDGFLPPP